MFESLRRAWSEARDTFWIHLDRERVRPGRIARRLRETRVTRDQFKPPTAIESRLWAALAAIVESPDIETIDRELRTLEREVDQFEDGSPAATSPTPRGPAAEAAEAFGVVRGFLRGSSCCDDLEDSGDRAEVYAMRELYRVAAFGAAGLSRAEWAAVGVVDPHVAAGLAELGVVPRCDLWGAPSPDEWLALVAAFPYMTARTAADLVEDHRDAWAWLNRRRRAAAQPPSCPPCAAAGEAWESSS